MERNEQMNRPEKILDWMDEKIMPWITVFSVVLVLAFFALLVIALVVGIALSGWSGAWSGGVERACIIGQDGLEYCR